MDDDERRQGADRRVAQDRRSGTDTRSADEKQLFGERRSRIDRRSDRDRRAEQPSTEHLALFARRLKRTMNNEKSRGLDRKSTRLNSSHTVNSYAVFCL